MAVVPAAGVTHEGTPAVTVRTVEVAPIPRRVNAPEPVPYNRSPLVVAVLIVGVVNAGDVRVLLVNVSVPVKVARVRVPVGKVIVPLFEILAIIGLVRVLFVKVCVPVNVATVESIAIVPLDVLVPPDRPVPATMLVTVPVAA